MKTHTFMHKLGRNAIYASLGNFGSVLWKMRTCFVSEAYRASIFYQTHTTSALKGLYFDSVL